MTASIVLLVWLGVQGNLPALVLPAAPGAWVIRVETTGGFTGRGTGSVTASSAGELFCVSMAACPDHLGDEAHRSLADLIAVIPLVRPPAPAPPPNQTVCNDCVTTTMTIRRRAPEGERVIVYTWDPSTVATVPPEIRRLHAAVRSLTSRRDR